MGGKSSSSSSSNTSTTQIDERIAATDNATVYDIGEDAEVSFSDFGAIEGAGLVALQAIDALGAVALNAQGQGQAALDGLTANADKTFEFVNQENQEENSTNFQKAFPWLMGGVAVIALSRNFKF